MRVDVSGHHVRATSAIRNAVDRKLSRISKHFPTISHLNAKINVEKNQHNIELDTQYSGKHFSVTAKSSDMYAAISNASEKLHSALSRQKESLKARRHDKTEQVAKQVDSVEIDTEEEIYAH